MHCGSLVVTADKQELLKRDSRQTQKFLETLAQDCGLDLSQLNLDEFRRSAFESCSSEAAEALAEANARRLVDLRMVLSPVKPASVFNDAAGQSHRSSCCSAGGSWWNLTAIQPDARV